MKRRKNCWGTLALKAAVGGAIAFSTVAAQAQQAPLKPLKVQIGAPTPYIGIIFYYVAQQAGIFKAEGLEVEGNYSSGAPQATQVTAAGQADVAIASVEPTIIGHDKGIRTKMLLRLNNQLIYWIAVPEDSPVTKVADLKGKKIGVSNLGSAAVPVVRSMLRTAGIPAGPDTLVPVGVFDQAMSALRSGNVQALGLFDGIYFGMERAGHRFRYFHHPTLTQFGNASVIAGNAAIENKKAEICSFSRSMAKAVLFASENPDAVLRMWWKVSPSARRGATEAEAVANGLPELQSILKTLVQPFPPSGRFGEFDQKGLSNYMEVLKQDGVIEKTPSVNDVMSNDFVACANQFDSESVRKLAREWKN